jgi:hypothetical protein
LEGIIYFSNSPFFSSSIICPHYFYPHPNHTLSSFIRTVKKISKTPETEIENKTFSEVIAVIGFPNVQRRFLRTQSPLILKCVRTTAVMMSFVALKQATISISEAKLLHLLTNPLNRWNHLWVLPICSKNSPCLSFPRWVCTSQL